MHPALLLGATVLRFSEITSPEDLARVAWKHAPDLAAARARVADARTDVDRTHLLPNPTADLSMNTIPVGDTNPQKGVDRLRDVPNYAVALSQLFEIGKRGPRRRAAEHALSGVELDVRELLRQRTLDLAATAAEIAASEDRIAALEGLVDDAAELTALMRARASKGDIAELDADRAELEEARLRSTLGEEREHLAASLTDCGRLAGVSCEPFGLPGRAASYLRTLGQRRATRSDVAQRPDLRSLEAQRARAETLVQLADARSIPDPTVRVGYVRDEFLISGNQGNSLFLGLSIPLPVFDRGQVDARAARQVADAARDVRARLEEAARREQGRVSEALEAARARQARLRNHTLPAAQRLIERLGKSVTSGGTPLSELLIARRTLGDLLGDAANLDLAVARLALQLARATGGLPADIATITGGRP